VALHNARAYADARAADLDVEAICAAVDRAGGGVAAIGRAAGIGGLLEAAAPTACEAFAAVSCVASAGGVSAGFSGSRGEPQLLGLLAAVVSSQLAKLAIPAGD
jgi:hypothetical protein